MAWWYGARTGNLRRGTAQIRGNWSGSSEYIPGDVPKRRTRLLNKADGKNRESENPEEISLLSGRNPTVVLGHRGKRFETENRQRRGEVAQVFVNTIETTRPRRVAPRGLALTDDRRSWRMGIWLPI